MPAVIPILIGTVIAGTVIDAVGKKKAGDAAKSLGDYNAAASEAQAQDAVERGQLDEQRFRQGVKGIIGKQRAGFAGQNVDVGQGSAVDVQGDAAYLGELDALTIRTNAAREAWGYRVKAENYRRGGANAQSAGNWGAASTALGGASTAVSLLANKYGWA